MDTLLWKPADPAKTNMHQFMRFVEKRYAIACQNYAGLHAWSIQHPADFWESLCQFFQIHFNTAANTILNNYDHMIEAKWFSGARLNFAEKLLAGKDEDLAIVSINENGERDALRYKALREAVGACAAALKKEGVKAGDRVAALMPNIAETVIAMLATASIGAIWSSCSPDFGAQAVIDRLGQIEPKILFACDGHQYQGKKHAAAEKIMAIEKAIPSLSRIIITKVIHETDSLLSDSKCILWEDFIQEPAEPQYPAFPFAHPLYILFSSGTTGKPKCIIHSAGGTLLQHIKELGLHCDIGSNDNHCFYTTCGWMMWNWMVSTLALGARLTLYEGSPVWPDANRLFQLIVQEKITVFGTSAKFISTVEKSGLRPIDLLAESSLRCILSTGSPLLPANFDFVYQAIKKDVQLASISGGTDIVSCFALGNPMLPVYRGELQCIGLGMDVAVYDENGQAIEESRGELVCRQAFPSMPIGFWNDPDKKLYQKAYFSRFPGLWTHGDFAEKTRHGGLIIYGRSDTVLNPGGVRIGTAEIYRQLEQIPEITDSVVIGQDWQGDVRIVLFVKLKNGLILDEALVLRIKNHIKNNASPRHVPALVLQTEDVPRTLSGKIMEIAVRQVVHGETPANLESMANPESLEYFKNRIPIHP